MGDGRRTHGHLVAPVGRVCRQVVGVACCVLLVSRCCCFCFLLLVACLKVLLVLRVACCLSQAVAAFAFSCFWSDVLLLMERFNCWWCGGCNSTLGARKASLALLLLTHLPRLHFASFCWHSLVLLLDVMELRDNPHERLVANKYRAVFVESCEVCIL